MKKARTIVSRQIRARVLPEKGVVFPLLDSVDVKTPPVGYATLFRQAVDGKFYMKHGDGTIAPPTEDDLLSVIVGLVKFPQEPPLFDVFSFQQRR
jgi:hypothetical protein